MKVKIEFDIPDNGDCSGCPFLQRKEEGMFAFICNRFDKVVFEFPNNRWYEQHCKPTEECENK